MENITIEDLGYNPFFESGRNRLKLDNFSVARVVAEFREAYKVKNEKGEYLARVTGKQMFEASGREDYPAVGDWVAITELDKDIAVIRGILPRATMIARKYGNKTQIIATNINTAFVVESADRDYNLNRFERYLAIAANGGVKPAIILNKVDLLPDENLEEKLTELKNRFPGIDIIPTSTVDNKGLEDLKNFIAKGKTYCFLGSSGVGKSSLINKLLGENVIETGGISSYSGRGKHVTTGRQMYFLENGPDAAAGAGGIVIDNPGMREVGTAEAGQGIDAVFNEISALAQECKYADCTHIHEPDCAVLNAVKSGNLDGEKYSNYLNLKKEAEHYEMSDFEKKEKDRRFGKFIKKAKKELKDLGHKDY